MSDAKQTEDFFAAAFPQYDGVKSLASEITIMAKAPHSVWADVTWIHDGRASERMCYQLVRSADSWQIAVLTLMDLPEDA